MYGKQFGFRPNQSTAHALLENNKKYYLCKLSILENMLAWYIILKNS